SCICPAVAATLSDARSSLALVGSPPGRFLRHRIGPHAGTTDPTAGRRQGRTYPPAPGASGLDYLGARRGGRATLAPPQALFCAHYTRGRERTVCAWCTQCVSRGQCQAFPERALYCRASPERRPRLIGRMYTPELRG